MRNLLAFLARYNYWLVFVVLEVISFVLLLQYNSYQASAWFSTANRVSGKLLEWRSGVESFFSLSKVNTELTQRNLYLERQVTLLGQQLADKAKDTTALRRSQQAALDGYQLIPAKVIGNSLRSSDNLITLDKGSADGVRKDMGVVSGTGVVGIVYLVSTYYSVVIPVLNVHSNISCTIKNRGYFGYLHWNGGAADIAYLDDVPRHAHFKFTDPVVTSGYSAVFPPGILVGRILHVYNSPDGLSYRLQVKLATDFGNLRDVCIIDNKPMIEQMQAIQAAQDSIQADGE